MAPEACQLVLASLRYQFPFWRMADLNVKYETQDTYEEQDVYQAIG